MLSLEGNVNRELLPQQLPHRLRDLLRTIGFIACLDVGHFAAAQRFAVRLDVEVVEHIAGVAVRGIGGGMTAITITGILLTQTDRLIVSHLLPLNEFGVYVVAGTLAAGLYVVISPMFSIVFPRIAALWSKGDMTGAAQLYHGASQVMALLVLPLTAPAPR